LRKVGRLKAAWPCGRSCRCSSQRRRRGIFVVVKRQPTKRRQARHLQKPYPEYAAPPELGNSPRDTATMMPRLRRSHQLPLLPCAARAKYSRKCQTSRVLRQSRRVFFGLITPGSVGATFFYAAPTELCLFRTRAANVPLLRSWLQQTGCRTLLARRVCSPFPTAWPASTGFCRLFSATPETPPAPRCAAKVSSRACVCGSATSLRGRSPHHRMQFWRRLCAY
jgi:hypothetical protein